MSSVVWDAEKRLTQWPGRELRRERRVSYWPLSFIDGVNGVRVGGEQELDNALEAAGQAAGIRVKCKVPTFTVIKVYSVQMMM